MSAGARGFRYELEALLTKRTLERDEAAMNLSKASARLRLGQERLDMLEVRFAAARADWERHQAGIALHWQQVSSSYLRDLGRGIVEVRAEIVQAERERDAAAAAAVEAHRALEVVERHRSEALGEFERLASRKLFGQADEAFVQRRANEGAA